MSQSSADPALGDLRDLTEKVIGIYYNDVSLGLLADRLHSRLTVLQLGSLRDYYYFLKWDPRRDNEWEHLLEHLTVNETHFWRESDSIELAAKKIRERKGQERPFRVWHAACSTGEEPYSLAMAGLRDGSVPGRDFELLASDLDPKALSAAIHASYSQRALRNLPESLRSRFFRDGDKRALLAPEVRACARFFRLNLNDSSVIWPQGYDMIFCRNVFIYFRPQTVREVVGRFASSLVEGGYLILGAAESLLQLETDFDFHSESGVIVYRKKSR